VTHPASIIAYNNVTTFRIGIRHNLHLGYTSPGFTIRNNTVQSYAQNPIPPQVTAPTAWQGIRVENIQQSAAVTVTNNSVDGNRSALQAAGYTRIEGLNITNSSTTSPNIVFSINTVTDSLRGAFHETPAVPNFTCNTLTSNTEGVAVDANASNGLVAHNNNIAGNITIGMQNSSATSVNAQANWWGAANGPGPVGPGSGDGVSTNVDYSNFLTGPVSCQPTAASISLSGRVLTPSLRGLSNAVVTAQGSDGKTYSARTSAFGMYRIDNLPTIGAFVISVSSRSYSFSPRIISATDHLTDVDLIANNPRARSGGQ